MSGNAPFASAELKNDCYALGTCWNLVTSKSGLRSFMKAICILLLAASSISFSQTLQLKDPTAEYIAARKKAVDQAISEFPALNDPKSELRAELARLYAAYEEQRNQILNQEGAPLMIAREANRRIEDK